VNLFLFTFGKLKTPGLREAADYYKRISSTWVPIQEIELKPLSVPDKSPTTRLRIQEKEGELLLERLTSTVKSRSLIYLMDELGKAHPSEGWAQQWQEWEKSGASNVSLCIGSSLGFSSQVRATAHGRFSLGPQTLSHELARVVLLEQVYRSFSILKGHPYHNSGS
jgi:23S rRNA (pseudouridine1915-N3)-methyltransferase